MGKSKVKVKDIKVKENKIKSDSNNKNVIEADSIQNIKDTNDEVLLSIQGASYRYSDAEENEYALKDVSYDFKKGKIYAIRGRSGTGKTTLLSLISGLERCTEGTIVFDGKNLKDINLDTYRNSHCK